MTKIKIKDGFSGQRLVVYPFYTINAALQNTITSGLVVHSMGYFPHAEGHFIDRPSGCGEYLLIYCIRGSGWYIIDDQRYEVGSHQFFVLPANQPHQYGSSDSNPWYIYWVHFLGSNAQQLYEKIKQCQSLDIDTHSRLDDRIQMFDELLNVMEGEATSDSIEYVNLGFVHLLSSFIHVNSFRTARYPERNAESVSIISKVTHYMEENLSRPLTIAEMAEYMNYSESYFYRLFYKETKFAPMTYFLHLKAERAEQMLLNTQLKINQIAVMLGFDDPYYFSRFFKRFKGLSPKEFRQQNSKQICED